MKSNPQYRRVCAELRRARLAAGLSEAELAARLEESPTYVAEYEEARRTLLVEELFWISHHLGVTPGRILDLALQENTDGQIPG